MDQDTHDFSALRSLLALKKHDYPQDTQVEDFLTEFHRRQRAQLFVRKSLWVSTMTWVKERFAGFDLVPSLSYSAVAAAIALTAFIGLSQQVAVTTNSDGQTRFSFRMPLHETSFAMLPGTLLSSESASPKLNDSLTFTPSHNDAAATRYVLANNTPGPMTRRLRSSLRPVRRRAVGFLVFALPLAGALVISGPARATDLFQLSTDETNALFDKAKGAVVQVRSGNAGMINAGSGFFIDDQGTVLTSSTILDDNASARVVINGVEMDAKILGNDPHSGLAMLKVDYNASPALPLAHASALQSGDGVMVVGFPLNLPIAPSQGPVSGFDASYLTRVDSDADGKSVAAVERFSTTHIHANAAISPGEIGAPLLNAQGEVVGIVATSPDDGRSVYALPIEAVQKVMGDFAQFGHARQGWVGVNVMPSPDQHDGRTVRVVDVVAGSPASETGIEPGDTLMRIDAREIYRPADVLDASFFSQVGTTMSVVVRRDDKLYNFSFPVLERPASLPAVTTKEVVRGAKSGAPVAADPAQR